ncbi:MAG: cytochrome c maturation protein CcmE [Archangium sp.]|nr:cytochrome c maturation protein CcmE [Archangium sp.]
MKPETRNRLIALGAILVAGGALAWIAFGNIGENLVYYWKPSEMVAQGDKAYGATVRLGGVVVPGSVVFNADRTALTFKVADTHAADAVKVTVKSEQTPPQMFREGIGVVVEGAFQADQVFRTNRLMVNHSNEYRAPTDGGMPTEAWKQSITQAD